MKKKFFLFDYVLEGLILAAAATDYIPLIYFLPLFVGIFSLAYWKDGLQATTLYYIPFGIAFLIGQAIEIENFNMYLCVSVVFMQYIESPVYQLPQNKKLVGFRKERLEDGEESFEFFPLKTNENIIKTTLLWDQGRAFEKIIASK